MKRILALTLLATCFGASACESVSVNILPFEPRFDDSITFRDLSKPLGYATVGLTTVKYSIRLENCTLTVGYKDPIVSVAKEFAANECAHAHIMTHEMKHVEIYKESLETLKARVTARLGDADIVKSALEELSVVKKHHEAHDSPEEYALNKTACSGKIFRIYKTL